MGLINDFFSAVDFRSVVSDTYTLIVGFVAIGIPLALQFAGQASDRYDNALLAQRLTKGWLVNPYTLIILSVLYVASGVALKLSTNHDELLISETNLSVLTGVSVTLFIITIVSSTWFYFRFYRRILKTTSQYIPDFLKLERSLFVQFCIFLNAKKETEWVSGLIGEHEFKKYSKRDYEYVSTGVEVLLDQLKSKSWDDTYKNILWHFHIKVSRAYFGEFKKKKKHLCKLDILFLKLYWDALLRLIRIARSQCDIEMSFTSQRYLSSLLTNIVHHAQFSEIVAIDFNMSDEDGIRWETDIFETARWQSHQGNEGIDLILECEWFGDITSVVTEPDIRNSADGTVSAFRCLGSIWGVLAKNHPDKILSAYKNISNNLPSKYGHDYYPDFIEEELRWLFLFFHDFYSKNFVLNNYYNVEETLHTLISGEAYVKYADFGKSRPITQTEFEQILERIDFKELYKEAYISQSEYSAMKLLASLAFFERWNEIGECLEWRQPSESKVQYIGKGFFPDNSDTLAKVLFDKYELIENEHWFYDRHDMQPFVYRGALYALVFFYKKSNFLGPLFTNGNLVEARKYKGILKGLMSQQHKLSKVVVHKDLMDVVNVLKASLEQVEVRETTQKLEDSINNDIWFEYKSALLKGWNDSLVKSGPEHNVLGLFQKALTHKIQPFNYTLLNLERPREDFLEGASIVGNFKIFGSRFYDEMVKALYSELENEAKKQQAKDILLIDNLIAFASKNELIKLGFEPINGRGTSWMHTENKSWYGVLVKSKDTLIVDIESVYITISVNGKGQDTSPIFSYLEDNNESKVNVIAEAYFDLEFSNSSVCFILN